MTILDRIPILESDGIRYECVEGPAGSTQPDGIQYGHDSVKYRHVESPAGPEQPDGIQYGHLEASQGEPFAWLD